MEQPQAPESFVRRQPQPDQGPWLECNVGPAERYVRLGMGLTAAAMAIGGVPSERWRLPLSLAALSGIFTGITRYCPLNALLGIHNGQGCEWPRLLRFDT